MNSLIILESSQTSFDFLKIFKNIGSEGILNFLNNLIAGLFIILIGWVVLKILIRSLSLIMKKSNKISQLMIDYLRKIISVSGWVIIIVTFLSQLGVDIAPVIAGLGITGIILGFAFQDSLSNFFAGAMIVINEPFRKGDYIEIGSFSGTVKKMDLMCVTLSPPDGKRITIANKYVWAEPIINYSFTKNRGVSMTIGVSYDADLRVCKKLFKEMLEGYPEVLKDPSPTIEVHSLGDSSINFLIRPWVNPQDYWTVHWRFHGEVVEKLAEKGICVPYPQMDIHLDK